ncbi:rRNA maturation RNase YbeY [bacterium]|nr:rRNA maturation RNase YbeY [bacterium]MBU3955094.1 rRNA maturation RNase YbeY [bacterium]MBU4133821.1 rRNA maturation RNase YbeY [bacterium]
MFRTEFFSEVSARGLNIKRLENFSKQAAKALALKSSVNVILTGAALITKLNRRFFLNAGLTDVIAFDLRAPQPLRQDKLCEVYVCLPAARKSALMRGHSITRELKILIVHGLLHLRGMGDATPSSKKKMLDEGDMLLKRLEK